VNSLLPPRLCRQLDRLAGGAGNGTRKWRPYKTRLGKRLPGRRLLDGDDELAAVVAKPRRSLLKHAYFVAAKGRAAVKVEDDIDGS